MHALPLSFQRDLLRALQLSYYVDTISIVSDYEFDMMEKEYEEKSGEFLPVGADIIDGYTEAERALALYLQFSHGKRRAKKI